MPSGCTVAIDALTGNSATVAGSGDAGRWRGLVLGPPACRRLRGSISAIVIEGKGPFRRRDPFYFGKLSKIVDYGNWHPQPDMVVLVTPRQFGHGFHTGVAWNIPEIGFDDAAVQEIAHNGFSVGCFDARVSSGDIELHQNVVANTVPVIVNP